MEFQRQQIRLLKEIKILLLGDETSSRSALLMRRAERPIVGAKPTLAAFRIPIKPLNNAQT